MDNFNSAQDAVTAIVVAVREYDAAKAQAIPDSDYKKYHNPTADSHV